MRRRQAGAEEVLPAGPVDAVEPVARIDWTGQENFFGTGLPPAHGNEGDWALMRPLLRDASIVPTPADIAFTRGAFLDLMRIRASTTLLRLRTAGDVMQRLRFHNTGPDQNPVVIVGEVDGRGYEGSNFNALMYLVNVSPEAQQVAIPEAAGRNWTLHPIHRAPRSADGAPHDAGYEIDTGHFDIPPRTAVVFVIPWLPDPVIPAQAGTQPRGTP